MIWPKFLELLILPFAYLFQPIMMPFILLFIGILVPQFEHGHKFNTNAKGLKLP